MSTKINRRMVLTVAAVCGLAMCDTAVAADAPKYRAPDRVLAVGVGENSHLEDLPGAANDPKLFASLWPSSEAITVVNREATAAGIKKAFGRLKGEVKPGGFSAILLSGHGGRSRGSWDFCPHDYDPANPSRARLDGAWIAGKVGELVDRGDRVLLVVDSCHAGELRSHLEHLLGGESGKGELILLAASVPSQFSLDGDKNGLFTTAVAEGLRGRADTDGDGLVTLKELQRYIAWRLRELVRKDAKLPGVAWSEQDAVCDASASVGERLPLSVAREKKAERNLAGLRLQAEMRVGPELPGIFGADPDLDAVGDRRPPVPADRHGVWQMSVPFEETFVRTTAAGEKQSVVKKFRDTVTLRLETGKRYTIEYRRETVPDAPGGRSRVTFQEVGSGTCARVVDSLVLDYENGLEMLTVESWGARELKLTAPKLTPLTRNWPKGTWTLVREGK